MRRILMSIFIHDVELAKLHHHEPIIRHSLERLPRVSSPELFAAQNASQWKRLIGEPARDARTSPAESRTWMAGFGISDISNDFQSYGLLATIGAMGQDDHDAETTWVPELLTQWYQGYRLRINTTNHDPFSLMILWHSTFINLHANFDQLECACGKEDDAATQKHMAAALAWARSDDAKRCVLHAVLIQKAFQSMPIGTEPAIHVPMALYFCGIVWTSYTRFGARTEARDLSFPELKLLGTDQDRLLQETLRGVQLGRPESRPFFKVVDMLQRMSQWKVAESFASTLLGLVEDSADLF